MLYDNISELRQALNIKVMTSDLDDNAKSKLRLTENQIADLKNWKASAYVGSSFFVCNQTTGNFYAFTAEDGFISVHEIKWH